MTRLAGSIAPIHSGMRTLPSASFAASAWYVWMTCPASGDRSASSGENAVSSMLMIGASTPAAESPALKTPPATEPSSPITLTAVAIIAAVSDSCMIRAAIWNGEAVSRSCWSIRICDRPRE